MTDFVLFGTEGCHLCEAAEQILIDAAVDFAGQDIMYNDEWQQQYGLLIPVLRHIDSQRQLNWPFDSGLLREFVGLCKGD